MKLKYFIGGPIDGTTTDEDDEDAIRIDLNNDRYALYYRQPWDHNNYHFYKIVNADIFRKVDKR